MTFVKSGTGIIRIVCHTSFHDRIGDESFVSFYIPLCLLLGEFVSYPIGDLFILMVLELSARQAISI